MAFATADLDSAPPPLYVNAATRPELRGVRVPIYLDYNATTPLDPYVLERMLPYFTEHYGNPSSVQHAYGWAAEAAVNMARTQVASALGVRAECVTFTGGASESINTAVKGIASAYRRKGRHIVTVDTEHVAMIKTCQALRRQGCRVTFLPVDCNGLVDLDELESVLSPDTILVSVMWANNETGVLQPVKEIAARVRARGILFMTDATQAIGKIKVSAQDADIMVASAHKHYGPKGVGILYLKERIRVPPLLHGGGQERGRRAGTLNVPGIVGMGASFEVACASVTDDGLRMRRLRDLFEGIMCDALPGLRINGRDAPRLPNTSSLALPAGAREVLSPKALGAVALSRGSACSSAGGAPSHVLRAMGLQKDEAERTVRVSIGRPTTEEEVRQAASALIRAAELAGAKAQALIPDCQ